MQEKDWEHRLKITRRGPGDRRLHTAEPGPAELRLKRLRKTVVIIDGKFYLSASPWHNNVKEANERPEGQKPGYDCEE